jgi:hypothetical protein
MGFKKSVDINNSGFFADYINVEVFQYDRTREGTKQIVAKCAVYKSKEDRDNGVNPITHFEVFFKDDIVKDAILKEAYNKLKTLDQFEGAEDV